MEYPSQLVREIDSLYSILEPYIKAQNKKAYGKTDTSFKREVYARFKIIKKDIERLYGKR